MKKLLSLTLLCSLATVDVIAYTTNGSSNRPHNATTTTNYQNNSNQQPTIQHVHVVNESKENDNQHKDAATTAFVKVPVVSSAMAASLYLLWLSQLSIGNKAMFTLLISIFGVAGIEYLLASKAKINTRTRKRRSRKIATAFGIATAIVCGCIHYNLRK